MQEYTITKENKVIREYNLTIGNFYQAYNKNKGRKYYFYVKDSNTVALLAQSIKGIYLPLEYYKLNRIADIIGKGSNFEEVTDLNIGWYIIRKKKKRELQAYRVLYCYEDISVYNKKNLIKEDGLLAQKVIELLDKEEYKILYMSTLGSFTRSKLTGDIRVW